MSQGVVSFERFGGNDILGGQITLSRGVSPGVGALRMLPTTTVAIVGDLRFYQPSVSDIYLRDVATEPQSLSILRSRQGYVWDIKILDRRWRWRYPTISGEYNSRGCDGRVIESSRKTLRQLADLCLAAMDESGADTSVLPENVYPPVNWRETRAATELAWLCEQVGCVPCLKLNNKVVIEQLGTGNNYITGDERAFRYELQPSVKPKRVEVHGPGTSWQTRLVLQAVGLDTDGNVKPVDNLSYKPAAGWGSQWWGAFPDVDPAARHLAVMTVWRWYRVIGQETGGLAPVGVAETDVLSLDQFALDDTLLETVGGVCQGAVVTGSFWPLCDHKINTAAATVHPGPFTILKERRVVAFDYPVFRWQDGLVAPAALKLIVGYRLKRVDGLGYLGQTLVGQDTNGVTATMPRVLRHPELRDADIQAAVYGGYGNRPEVLAEAQVYLDRVASTYRLGNGIEMLYDGIKTLDLDGAVAQIRWKAGHGEPCSTRVGFNMEFEGTVPSYAARRQAERVIQLAERENV